MFTWKMNRSKSVKNTFCVFAFNYGFLIPKYKFNIKVLVNASYKPITFK